mmetsp:Transcript_41184/g.131807  ORF Transcript_41184/g.131807 Transcript_41184/m.131807 type:complete len:283 (-) Transcript_41184:377-1225(-)
MRHLSTTVVLDIERKAPTNTPSAIGAPLHVAIVPPRAMKSRIWMAPPPMAAPLTLRSLARENSMPRVKSMSITPSCARVSTCTRPLTRPRPPGPMAAPARRYPVITGCPSAPQVHPPTAAPKIIPMMSFRKTLSCCSSMDPPLGLDITNSLSFWSTSRSTASLCSPPPPPPTSDMGCSLRSSARRKEPMVASPGPRGASASALEDDDTRTTVSSVPLCWAWVSLKLRPADPWCWWAVLSSFPWNSLSSTLSTNPAMPVFFTGEWGPASSSGSTSWRGASSAS